MYPPPLPHPARALAPPARFSTAPPLALQHPETPAGTIFLPTTDTWLIGLQRVCRSTTAAAKAPAAAPKAAAPSRVWPGWTVPTQLNVPCSPTSSHRAAYHIPPGSAFRMKASCVVGRLCLQILHTVSRLWTSWAESRSLTSRDLELVGLRFDSGAAGKWSRCNLMGLFELKAAAID